MRKSIARLVVPTLLLAASLALAACGFRPLYATGPDGTGPGDALASIYVEPIPERVGYELRNQLLDRLGATGRSDGVAYRLKIALRETS